MRQDIEGKITRECVPSPNLQQVSELNDAKEDPQWDMELMLVRHGTTLWNKERRYLGHTDLGLLSGAEQELQPLQEKLQGHSFARIYCSDLMRCRQTLQIILPESTLSSECSLSAMPPLMEPRLRELHFGEWDGQTYDMLKDVALYRAWIDEPQRITPPGGESWNHFVNRLREFLDSLFAWRIALKVQPTVSNAAPPSVLVVTHGGVIRQLACMLISGHDFWSLNPKPGEAFRIQLRWAGPHKCIARLLSY
ncbi:histidine phosphatase family protein [Paenibacillus sp. CMAA1739]|uniref:histidine phosphatase family protein n=1 Tax=Paenibacillus ottowii TaxID=2315729 RepID=UPI00272F80E0|nr:MULTISPECIES: histidine phosphatase family protein [Paenibacillus]MDP1509636.1 histidine phosphatase family protein [Paenibacillus ottowii]MEC4566900.1 histidine phosphatase family protein [Paenibacillus sp. CMAA1739]